MLDHPIARFENLKVEFQTQDGPVEAVKGVSFDIAAGETVAIVGESGSGKSVSSLSLMRLVEYGGGEISDGRLLFDRGAAGQIDLRRIDPKDMRAIRGREIGMIFQEPMTSLNPVFTIGEQIMESVQLHQKASKKEARDRAIDMLRLVKIAEPEKRIKDFPHQLSGGMRQRVMIAMALCCNPTLLMADEPTTALDVTIQAQILELIGELQEQLGMAVLLITHDLGVVAEQADEVAV
ncbi:MAG: ABC transporter ATP-binding protein, partial [Rhodobacteraceae bacterium]|nr:ABC transporter ATP-binding protein [Paracoccaceae bacterium]